MGKSRPFQFFILSLLLGLNSKLYAYSFAELSYDVFIGKCPNDPIKLESLRNCASIKENAQKNYIDINQSVVDDVAKHAYLAELAQDRSNALKCSENQISELEGNSENLSLFIDFYSQALLEISREGQKLEVLRPAITSNEKAKNDYREGRLKIEALTKALPYSETGAMKKLISSIASQSDIFAAQQVNSTMKTWLDKNIIASLKIAKKEIQKNISIMSEGYRTSGYSLSRIDKESLAQDFDLIEKYKMKSNYSESALSKIACPVDAEYGRGAMTRDTAMMATSVITGGLAAGVARLGIIGVTGASARGIITMRSAGVLRTLAMTSGAATVINQFENTCLKKISLKAALEEGKNNICEKDIINSLKKDSCAMALVFSGLAGVTIFKQAKIAKNELVDPARTVEKLTAKGARAEAYMLEEAAKSKNTSKMNRELVDAYNKSVPSGDAVNNSINVAVRAENSDLPKKMLDRISRLKEQVESTKFSRAVFKRSNNTTSAKDNETVADFLPGDIQMSRGFIQAFKDLHDKQKFANYMEDLVAEVTRKMLKSGDTTLQGMARNGVLDEKTMASVLEARIIARGLKVSVIPKDADVVNFRQFQNYLREGPILDAAMGPGHRLANEHGMYTHLLQLDYALPGIEKFVGKSRLPVVFEYLGTERGSKYWNETFDLFTNESKAVTNTTFLKEFMKKDGLNLP